MSKIIPGRIERKPVAAGNKLTMRRNFHYFRCRIDYLSIPICDFLDAPASEFVAVISHSSNPVTGLKIKFFPEQSQCVNEYQKYCQ